MAMTVSQILRDKKFKLFSFNGSCAYENGEHFFLAFAPVRGGYVSVATIKALRRFGFTKVYGQPTRPKGKPDVYLSSGYGLDEINEDYEPGAVQRLIDSAKAGKTKHIWVYYDPTTKEVKEIKWR